jgi:predicted adenine nucleotide alpha hydrolase (AANH) superfamily ATPase
MKLLLHCCCAPCSVAVVNSLRGEGIETRLFWYNPNIHLFNEYSSRRDCLADFALRENLELSMVDEYGLRSFLDAVYPDTGNNRCEKCYALRLEKAASFAAREGFSSFTTTLLISPYQNHEAVKQTGEAAGRKYGIEFLYRDFRPLFREGQAAARAGGFYMQKYCGCVFSEEERYCKPRKDGSNNGHQPHL